MGNPWTMLDFPLPTFDCRRLRAIFTGNRWFPLHLSLGGTRITLKRKKNMESFVEPTWPTPHINIIPYLSCKWIIVSSLIRCFFLSYVSHSLWFLDHHSPWKTTCVARKFTNPAASYRSRFPGWLKSSVLLPTAYISKRTDFVPFVPFVVVSQASPGSSKAKDWRSQVAHRASLMPTNGARYVFSW